MLELRLLHLIVRSIGQIGTLRGFDGNEFRLPAQRFAHPLEGRIGYGVPQHRLALKREPVELDRVQPVGSQIGRGRGGCHRSKRNAEVHAPIARANDRIAAPEVILFFLSCRQPKTRISRQCFQTLSCAHVAAALLLPLHAAEVSGCKLVRLLRRKPLLQQLLHTAIKMELEFLVEFLLQTLLQKERSRP